MPDQHTPAPPAGARMSKCAGNVAPIDEDQAVAQEDINIPAHRMRIFDESLANALLSNNFDNFIRDTIAFIGSSLSAQRCCFITCDESNRPDHISEWVSHASYSNEGRAREIYGFKIDAWFEKFNRLEVVKSDDALADTSPEFADISRIPVFSDMKSFLSIGVKKEGKVFALITVEFLVQSRKITDGDEYLLRSLGKILEIVIDRFHNMAKLEESARQHRLILESLNLPIMLYDADLKLVFVNSASAKTVGKPAAQILSEPCYLNYCKRDGMGEDCPVRKCARAREVIRFSAQLNGREMLNTVSPIIGPDGRLLNVVEFNFDITELNEKNRRLEKAMEAAQAADKAKSLFIANVSHELRTPLNAVIGYSELSQDRGLGSDTVLDNLKSINGAANSLLSLINDVLEISRLEAGRTDIAVRATDLRALLTEIMDMFKFRADAKHIGFGCVFAGEVPSLMLDPLRVRQVLTNIVGNAVKFTNSGHVGVEVSFEPDGGNSGTLRVEVNDTGMGMAPEFLPKVFDAFERQLENQAKDVCSREGTGLGLAISQRLARQMGGLIHVESELGKGSTFTVSIPGLEIFRGKTEPAQGAARPALSQPLPEGKVMIIDDIAMNLKVLEAVLRKIGVDVVSLPSAAHALEYMKVEKPAVILTDFWMPEMDGAAFAKEVRKNPAYADIPIAVVTADIQIKDAERIFDDILFKPITVERIRAVLGKFDNAAQAKIGRGSASNPGLR